VPELHIHYLTGSRTFRVASRTLTGTFRDGFIHAGNLAYLSMLALFPFFILGAALFALFGEASEREALIETILATTPPTVAGTIEPVARDVINAREGWLLWIGAGIALWTVSSLIETVRDILRRAYDVTRDQPIWKYRLASIGIILISVILLLVSLFAQVGIGTAQQVIAASFPQLNDAISGLETSRIIPAAGFFVSAFLLFYTLTPAPYRTRAFPKWPGALFITLWWLIVTGALPPLLRSIFTYNLTYGSLAGIMVTLFFFWLVGLGIVIGAELNAALAKVREDHMADDGQTKEGAA
jgi:membrane protein